MRADPEKFVFEEGGWRPFVEDEDDDEEGSTHQESDSEFNSEFAEDESVSGESDDDGLYREDSDEDLEEEHAEEEELSGEREAKQQARGGKKEKRRK